MGNTLLAHVLYSCKKIDIDFEVFFSSTGNAHQIQHILGKLNNKINLIAWHLLEFPRNDVRCLIEFIATHWMQVLQYKMAYSKWHGIYPTEYNYREFFTTTVDKNAESDKLWQEFYHGFKDPSWTECKTFNDIVNLPRAIQTEILSVYKEPDTIFSVLNLLTINYYDMIVKNCKRNFPGSVKYTLEEYFSGDFTIVKNSIQDTLSWNWDNQRSAEFHQHVLKVNSEYLTWLEKIINVFNRCINFSETDVDLEFWEKAIVLAKVCQHFNKHPNELDWGNDSCF